MENIINLVTAKPKISPNLRIVLTYFSAVLFIGLVSFVSLSINHYISDTMSIDFPPPQQSTKVPEETSEEFSSIITIQKGDTLKMILVNEGLPGNYIAKIIKLADMHGLSSSLQVGKQIIFDYDLKLTETEDSDLATEVRTLNKMTVKLDKINSLEIIRENDVFVAKNTAIALNKFISKSSAVINTSLMATLKSLQLSTNSIIELINSYSYQIDFQRQIQAGDTVTIITEKFVNEEGKFSHHGKILYASLNLSGQDYNIYRYSADNANNNASFFSEDGKSVKRSLLRTPVKVIRISSHYGNRLHPTLGYTRAHRGVDFAAPIGTPIYAAGDGVVTEACTRSGYGKFIQIKHSANLSTAYAHASRFAKNLKAGMRVKQGQVIAYVGKTGNTTGPHLHYEVKINGKHVNPMSIKTTPGIELASNQLIKFNQFKNKIKTLKFDSDNNIKIAADNTLLSMNE